MTLREMVGKYQALAGGFGRPVALADFGLGRDETAGLFSAFDEDYHISRFFHFTLDPALENLPGRTYPINGFPQSHVSLDREIQTIL
jgi:hypothetical protein